MSFLAKVWRLLVGIKDALVLATMLLFFALLYSLLSSTPNAAAIEDGALHVELDGTIVEQPERASPQDILFNSTSPLREHRLRDVVHVIETAATDTRIKAVALDLDGFVGGGQVSLQRVGAALDKVRKSGKPVIAHATGYSDDSYLLAAHASEIWLDPMGLTFIAGPGGSRPYFKGLIDKLGVTVRVYRVGKFKSFVEPYTRADQSPEAKQADQALVDSLFSAWMANVKAARPKAQLATYVQNPLGTIANQSSAQVALRSGMVDKLGDRIAWANRIAAIAGRDSSDPVDAFKGTDYADYLAAHPVPAGSDIGVVTVAGEIVDGEAPAGTSGGDTISRIILDAVAQKNLKALVVRVDSPGGSAIASEKIRQSLLVAKKADLPVIVSMANVAASGGYWIASAGDRIFAEPATITGSIGVFGIVPTFEKTLAKWGVTADGVATTPLSGQPDVLRGTNAVADQLIQSGVNEIYRRFTGLVSQQRRIPLARVEEIAQGRVWDGGSARQIGLVDSFGSLDDAIAEAAKRAKLDPKSVRPVYLDRMPNWFELYAERLKGTNEESRLPRDAYSQLVQRQQINLASAMIEASSIAKGPAVQVRCLSCPATPKIRADQGLMERLIAKLR
ncbi:MAG: signal peptide peptidase SppA [Chakrabartia sp.]